MCYLQIMYTAVTSLDILAFMALNHLKFVIQLTRLQASGIWDVLTQEKKLGGAPHTDDASLKHQDVHGYQN